MIVFFKQGGIMMVPLLICSFIAVSIVLERLVYWHRQHHNSDQLARERVRALLLRQQLEEVRLNIKESKDFLLKFLKPIVECDASHRRSVMDRELSILSREMHRSMTILETVISIAPLMGILGTIIGIIQSFGALGTEVQDPRMVSIGISQALITTVFGLTITILTIIPYNFFLSRIRRANAVIEQFGSDLEIAVGNHLEN